MRLAAVCRVRGWSLTRRTTTPCCWENTMSCGCRLEGGTGGVYIQKSSEPVRSKGRVPCLFSSGCRITPLGGFVRFRLTVPLDAGGLRFVWLTGRVDPGERPVSLRAWSNRIFSMTGTQR